MIAAPVMIHGERHPMMTHWLIGLGFAVSVRHIGCWKQVTNLPVKDEKQ